MEYYRVVYILFFLFFSFFKKNKTSITEAARGLEVTQQAA